MDVRALPLRDGCMDIVLDKATLDTLYNLDTDSTGDEHSSGVYEVGWCSPRQRQ